MYTCDSWQLVNSSQRGVCLMRDRRSVNTPMTDDLFGLQSAGREDQWAIGLVRWLSVDKTGTHRLGVELLSSNARAVSLQLDEMQTKPALGLASANAELIRVGGPGGTAESDKPLQVHFDGHEVVLHPRVVVESSNTVQCLDCSR